MFGLSRLLALAGKITWRTRRGAGWLERPRQPVRRGALYLEELEDRVVPTLLGQQLYPADYPWNQNISSAPVAANSAAIIAHIGASLRIHPDWGTDSAANGSSPLYGIPFNVVHGNSVAKVNVVIDNYPGESDIIPVPIPANAVIEGDYQNGPNPYGPGYNTNQRGDSHLIVWDEDNNIAYELFGAARPSDPVTMAGGSTGGVWHAAQESVWNMNTDSFRSLGYTSADAAGLSILAGLARPDEGLPTALGGQGAIDHALRFTLPSSDVSPQYIYPASHVVNDSAGSTKLPFGARLRLLNTPAVNNAIAAMGPEAQIIAHAMQQYGLVLADIGSSMYVTGTSASQTANNQIGLTWNMNDVLGLSALNAGDFQVVNLAPQVTGLSTSNGSAGNTVTIIGQNFSGAAGHLTVLFGGTAATGVTYVDDGHITAVVPAGSGTVNVQVQSGVIATDPNNPADNVNNPIFGYGTSATLAADQFTYINQTISGTNSTDSFATSSVASGNGDTLTIVVKDTGGNSVSGLPNSAFNLTLSGGASAGTFGIVTETATHGTYTATFTGTTAGTASTLTSIVGGVTLASQPTITVAPGAVSGANSTAGFAASNVVSGGTDALTIAVKDAAGNAVSGLINSAFVLSLSGGTSTGSFGIVTETATKGTYTAAFTGTTAGTASTLTATVSGVILTTKPKVQVTAGGVSGTNSTVSFASPLVGSGGMDTVTIVAHDSAGNAVSGLLSNVFGFSLSGGTSAGTFGTVTETALHGTYTATFTATTAGTPSTLTAIVGGVTLTTKPTITVSIFGIGPSGTIATSSPTFNWMPVTGAASYTLWLTDNTTGKNLVSPLLMATSWTPTQPLSLGDNYTWWIGAVNGQTTTWNTGVNFRIAPTGSGPSGTIATNVPVFSWNTVIGAASYEVWLTDTTTNQNTVVSNLSGTSWSPSQPLTLGHNYTWWVAAVQGQATTWDAGLSFRIAPTGSGPSGTITTNVPVFGWNAVAGAASYEFWLTDTTTNQNTVVSNLTVTSWSPSQPLTLGHNYTWWVAAVLGQTSAWDSALSFRIAPTGSAPTGTIATNMPVFGWNAVTGAASYEFWLTDTTTNQNTVVSNLTVTSWTPSQPLTPGHNYTWWVASVLGQTSAWDSALYFTIS